MNAMRVCPFGQHGVLSPIGRFYGHICYTGQFGRLILWRNFVNLHEKHETGLTVFSLWSCNKVVIFIGLTVQSKEWKQIDQIHVLPMESCIIMSAGMDNEISENKFQGLWWWLCRGLAPMWNLTIQDECIMNNLSFTSHHILQNIKTIAMWKMKIN